MSLGSYTQYVTDDTDPGFLFRGVSRTRYDETNGGLEPKTTSPFEYVFPLDGSITLDGSWTVGSSVTNAIRRHELRQEGFPTAGLSTTPSFERARFYATRGGTQPGYVLKIDRAALQQAGVTEYIVRDWVREPSAPEDHEVILVTADHGRLPAHVVVKIIEVAA